VCKADKPTDTAEKGDKAVKTDKVVEKAEILSKKKSSLDIGFIQFMCWASDFWVFFYLVAGKTEKAENGDTTDKRDTKADTSVKVKMETWEREGGIGRGKEEGREW
jgi:hypothetical protein